MKTEPNHPSEEEILNRIPGLNASRDVFSIPEGYFETLPERIAESMHPEKQRTPFLRQLFSKKWIWVPSLAAASVILLLFIIVKANQEKEPLLSNTGDTSSLITAYDASYAINAINSDYMLAEELLEEISDEETPVEISLHRYNDEEITGEAILEYLSEQDLDTEVLAQLSQP